MSTRRPGFVLLRVKPTEPPHFKRNFDAAFCRDRFRSALLVEWI